MTKLRVATIGAGYFSQFHYDAWSRIENVELVALCDVDQQRGKQMSERWSVPHVFDEPATMLHKMSPDLVDIITPPTSHLELIGLAAKNKTNAICQKAFCRSITEALEATHIAEQAGILLVVHENFRFQPWHVEIKRRIVAGELGKIYQAHFCLRPGDGRGAEAYLARQPYFQNMERFLVHETAIHFVDLFRFLFGEVKSVFADLRRLNPVIAGEDAGIIMFHHENGIRSIFDGNRLSDHPAKDRRLTMGEMLIEGEREVFRLDGDGNLSRRRFGSNEWNRISFPWPQKGFAGDSVRALQQHVVDHLVANRRLANGARDYIANLRVEEAIYASAHSRAIRDIA